MCTKYANKYAMIFWKLGPLCSFAALRKMRIKYAYTKWNCRCLGIYVRVRTTHYYWVVISLWLMQKVSDWFAVSIMNLNIFGTSFSELRGCTLYSKLEIKFCKAAAYWLILVSCTLRYVTLRYVSKCSFHVCFVCVCVFCWCCWRADWV